MIIHLWCQAVLRADDEGLHATGNAAATIRIIARQVHVAQGTICRIHIRKE